MSPLPRAPGELPVNQHERRLARRAGSIIAALWVVAQVAAVVSLGEFFRPFRSDDLDTLLTFFVMAATSVSLALASSVLCFAYRTTLSRHWLILGLAPCIVTSLEALLLLRVVAMTLSW